MKRNKIIVLLLLAGVAPVARAQTQQVDTSKPIVIQQSELRAKRVKFTGYVQHMNNVQITVRSKDHEMVLRTFSFAPEIREKMQEIIDLGGYQYGDKVTIVHEEGQDVALKVKGKRSPPI